MVEPVSATTAFLGTAAAKLVGSAIKDHVKAQLTKPLAAGQEKLLSKEQRDAIEVAYEGALTNAYTHTLEALGRVLELTGISFPEFVEYKISVERFLKTRTVADHLLETARDPGNDKLPDPAILESEWQRVEGKSFPVPSVWNLVAANFRKSAKERAFITPQLRDVLNAQNIDQIRQLHEKLLGVQIAVRHEQYVRRMLKKYAPVELANVAPSYAEDPGVLMVTDIFEPQHVRENPPPVEIAKDELEKLVRQGKIDKGDEAAVIAMLEEGEGKEAAERLRFQRASYAEQPVRPVLDVIGIPPGTAGRHPQRHRLLVITGEPGSGKSTLLRYLLLGILDPPADPDDPARALAWTEGFTGEHEHFPLLVELRDYYSTCRTEDSVNSLLDYVQHLGETEGYGIDAAWLDQRLRTGPSLVLFDGLDEVFDAADRDRIMQQIVGFAETYPRARVIVTSRPHGYHEGILRPAGFAHFRLQDFDRQQMARFTRAWFGRVFPQSPQNARQRIDRVLNSIDRSPSVRWLAGNPLLLTIMCLIAREKELPRERARFYEQCIDVLAHQWEINRHLEDKDLGFLAVEDKKDLLRRIAFHMQASEAGLRGNFIAEQELLAITQGWFEETFEDHKGAKARAAARQMVKGLWERNYLLCPRGPRLYGFLHRTFMEFLTATEYLRRFQKTPEFTLDDLDAVFREHGNDPEWTEVLRLICREVGDEYADKLIRTLLTLKAFPRLLLSQEDRPYHLIAGIRCFGELRGLSKMESLGRLSLQRCVEFLRCGYSLAPWDSFVRDEFLSAVEEIGERWPGKTALVGVDPGFEVNRPLSCLCWPEFEGAVFRDRNVLRAYATQDHAGFDDGRFRASALAALAKWWPDEATRQLLSERAVEDGDSQARTQALHALARHEPWADEATRRLLCQRAVQDEEGDVRAYALALLAGHGPWADEATRELLSQRVVEDEDVRAQALALLAGHEPWADEPTRQLLSECALEDEAGCVRAEALTLLAGHEPWADEATRELLCERAVEDEHEDVRARALSLLVVYERWADEATRQLLSQRAVEDEDRGVRADALELLGVHDSWAVDATRQLLSQRAVQDKSYLPRAQALELLAGHERWADDATRQLLSQRAVQEENNDVRAKALELLAGHEPWADEATRQLLSQRAVQEENNDVRAKILELLAGHEPWADEVTRQLLSQRGLEDEHFWVRAKALELLAGHEPWAAHEETLVVRQRVKESICGAAQRKDRGAAACAWFGSLGSSDPLSDAKKRVFSTDADGIPPYLDPRGPVSGEHLAKVAKRAGLSEDRIDEMVEQMNAALGWDIRKGIGPVSEER